MASTRARSTRSPGPARSAPSSGSSAGDLRVDGIAGPRTRRALGRLGRPLYGKRALRRGMVGWDVSVLQFLLLRSRSSAGAIDGAFGPRTRAATIRFQRRAGLLVDGIVGPQTRRALLGASPEAVRRSLNRWSRRYGVSPRLVRSLAWVESGHQSHVVSSAGARGVMQVTPATRRYIERILVGRRIPRTVDGNIHAGVAYLARQLRSFRPHVQRAIGAYYQGARAVRRHGLYPETVRTCARSSPCGAPSSSRARRRRPPRRSRRRRRRRGGASLRLAVGLATHG